MFKYFVSSVKLLCESQTICTFLVKVRTVLALCEMMNGTDNKFQCNFQQLSLVITYFAQEEGKAEEKYLVVCLRMLITNYTA